MLMVVLKKFANYFDSALYYFILMFDVEVRFRFLKSMGVKGNDGVEYLCLHMCNSEHDRYDVYL